MRTTPRGMSSVGLFRCMPGDPASYLLLDKGNRRNINSGAGEVPRALSAVGSWQRAALLCTSVGPVPPGWAGPHPPPPLAHPTVSPRRFSSLSLCLSLPLSRKPSGPRFHWRGFSFRFGKTNPAASPGRGAGFDRQNESFRVHRLLLPDCGPRCSVVTGWLALPVWTRHLFFLLHGIPGLGLQYGIQSASSVLPLASPDRPKTKTQNLHHYTQS